MPSCFIHDKTPVMCSSSLSASRRSVPWFGWNQQDVSSAVRLTAEWVCSVSMVCLCIHVSLVISLFVETEIVCPFRHNDCSVFQPLAVPWYLQNVCVSVHVFPSLHLLSTDGLVNVWEGASHRRTSLVGSSVRLFTWIGYYGL